MRGVWRAVPLVGAMLVPWAPAAGTETAPTRPGSAPPNIVFILADDLGWSELGCYGNTFNETPHLDALAARGVRFTAAYAAAPVCSPTRAGLMTGLYPARIGITDFLRGDDRRFLAPSYYTLAEALREAGYVTGLIGKWHLMGDYARRRGDPARHGFDEVICSETRYIADGDYFAPYRFMPDVEPLAENEYLTDRLNEEAIRFIRRHCDRPFFLYLSHYAVHTVLAAPPAAVERFRNKAQSQGRRGNPELAAMLAAIDEGLGRIIRAIDEMGLRDRTLVVFTSDNGGEQRVTSNAPLRGGKSQLYEGGIRVPLIVSGAGVGREGRVCDAPVVTVDFYPTLLELAGASGPHGGAVDGQSLVALLRDGTIPARQAIFWHFALDEPLGRRGASAVRRGDLKLIRYHDTGRRELYDLRRDPGESRNLLNDRPGAADELTRLLDSWLEEVTAGGRSRGAAPREAQSESDRFRSDRRREIQRHADPSHGGEARRCCGTGWYRRAAAMLREPRHEDFRRPAAVSLWSGDYATAYRTCGPPEIWKRDCPPDVPGATGWRRLLPSAATSWNGSSH